MDSNHRSWRQAVGPVMENGESFAGACRAGHPTVRRCGDVRLDALVKGSWLGSSVSLWAKPHPWRRATARRFFWLTGQKRVFRRGTKGSNPSPSSGESAANLTLTEARRPEIQEIRISSWSLGRCRDRPAIHRSRDRGSMDEGDGMWDGRGGPGKDVCISRCAHSRRGNRCVLPAQTCYRSLAVKRRMVTSDRAV
jgi:hypothetical protein